MSRRRSPTGCREGFAAPPLRGTDQRLTDCGGGGGGCCCGGCCCCGGDWPSAEVAGPSSFAFAALNSSSSSRPCDQSSASLESYPAMSVAGGAGAGCVAVAALAHLACRRLLRSCCASSFSCRYACSPVSSRFAERDAAVAARFWSVRALTSCSFFFSLISQCHPACRPAGRPSLPLSLPLSPPLRNSRLPRKRQNGPECPIAAKRPFCFTGAGKRSAHCPMPSYRPPGTPPPSRSARCAKHVTKIWPQSAETAQPAHICQTVTTRPSSSRGAGMRSGYCPLSSYSQPRSPPRSKHGYTERLCIYGHSASDLCKRALRAESSTVFCDRMGSAPAVQTGLAIS